MQSTWWVAAISRWKWPRQRKSALLWIWIPSAVSAVLYLLYSIMILQYIGIYIYYIICRHYVYIHIYTSYTYYIYIQDAQTLYCILLVNSVLLWKATSHNWDAHPSIEKWPWPWSPRKMGSNQHHKLQWRLMDVGLNASCRSLPNLLGRDATCGHPKNNEVHKCMHRRAMTWYSTLGPVSILHRYQSFIVFHGLDTLSVIKQSQKLAVVGWIFLLL